MITREIVEEATAHAGQTRQRVLSLVDRLHRDKAITFDQYAAAITLRMLIMAETPPSAGVSSYGDDAGRGNAPHGKSDRLGRRLTGYEIDFEGRVIWRGGRISTSRQGKLEDALFAAVGVFDEGGERRVNRQHAGMLMRLVLDSEAMPTLSGFTKELTTFYGTASRKGVPAYALGTVVVWLGRLAMHFRMIK